jgi:hypothetical protein
MQRLFILQERSRCACDDDMADLAKQMCHSHQTEANYYDVADRDLPVAMVGGTIQKNLTKQIGQPQVSHLGDPPVLLTKPLCSAHRFFLN